MAHREGIRAYIKEAKIGKRVIDWGCGTKPIMHYIDNTDRMFTNIDKQAWDHVDNVLDIEAKVDLNFKEYDTAFCLEVLEHCWDSKQLIRNIYNHLADNGVLYLSQPYHYRTHKNDDRIRYTHHGLRQLLEEAGFMVEDIKPTVGGIDNAEGFMVRARK